MVAMNGPAVCPCTLLTEAGCRSATRPGRERRRKRGAMSRREAAPSRFTQGRLGALGGGGLRRTHLVNPHRAQLDVIAVPPDTKLALGAGPHVILLQRRRPTGCDASSIIHEPGRGL